MARGLTGVVRLPGENACLPGKSIKTLAGDERTPIPLLISPKLRYEAQCHLALISGLDIPMPTNPLLPHSAIR